MYASKYRIAALVFTLSMVFFCVASTDCWSKDYSPNVHWVFCIDTSGSMKMKGHRDLLELITQKITNEFADPKKKKDATKARDAENFKKAKPEIPILLPS